MAHPAGGSDERGTDGVVLRESRAFQGPTEPPDGHDHTADHLALVYDGVDEQFATVVPFLRRGLERDERCVYVADDTSRDAVLAALRDGGIDVDDALDEDALVVLTPADVYRQAGAFDRDTTFDFWRDVLADAKADGYTGIRAAAEMTWALDDDTTADQLVEYEALLNPLYEGEDYTVLCQYDRARFPDDVLHDVISAHPLVVQGDTVSRNVYYAPPEEFFDGDRPGETVDRKLRTLRERTASKAALREHERHLRDLYDIVADLDRPFREKLRDVLDLGCDRFDMEVGGLARVDPAADRFAVEVTNGDHDDLVPGSEYPLSETYCRATVDDDGTCAVTDPAEFEGDLCHDQFGVRSYLGTHLELADVDADDRTLWFVSERPRDDIPAGDRTFLHLLGQWVRYELEQRHRTDHLVALHNLTETARDINRALAQQSTRNDVERLVCDRLAESDSYACAWIGTVEEGAVVPRAGANVPCPVEELPSVGADDLTDRAIRTGTPQVVSDVGAAAADDPWRTLADDMDVTGAAVLPITYDTRQYGVLAVCTTRARAFDEKERDILTQLAEIVGLAVAAIDHERELEHERERLAFFNRLLRHDLLNGLDLVRARIDIVERYADPEAADHVATIRDRTDDLLDLVQDMRSLMQAVVGTDDHELAPVDLGAVLDAEVERARRAFDDAEFRIEGHIDDAGEVLADDLLAEAFQNLLVNAVRHNDAATPRVTVAVDAGESAATIRIADNGPGIPDEIVDSVFEEGVKGPDSPGTGIGLHLVREIVDAYDGTITVEDRAPTGTVFAVSLPRPAGDD